MLETFLFAGAGGQGVMFAGQLLAYAAMDHGFEVTWIPSYGPEMRGGTAHCDVVISDHMIGSPVVKAPRVALVFNRPSLAKFVLTLAPAGLLVRNVTLAPDAPTRTDVTDLPIPATALADALGNVRLANVVMLGAALAAHPVLPIAALRSALESHLPAHHRDKLTLNLAALDAGVQAALKVESERCEPLLTHSSKVG
jgi:2-oxoglutarate ferredoxin oxidoreductase subunit gamma